MNMLSSVTPWDRVAEGYADTTMKFFQGYVDRALELVELDHHSQVLDVACGPGTLALKAARLAASVQAIDFSPAMISILDQSIERLGVDNIETFCGDAQQLPYDDAGFDAAFSMFGLMFFPDRQRGYGEMFRTLKPGGKLVISSWAPVALSPLMQAAFGALRVINPEIPEPQTDIESLENPDFMKNELLQAGFKAVEVHRLSQDFPLHSIEQFWTDMVRGNAPITMLKHGMDSALWQEKNRQAIEYLQQSLGEHTTALSSVAWLGVGTR